MFQRYAQYTCAARKIRSTLFWLCLPFIIAGCMGGAAGVTGEITSRFLDWMFEPDPTIVNLKFDASSNLNPCPPPPGNACPVVVRFYGLTSVDRFSTADFFDLYKNDETILEDDILFTKEMTILPDYKGEESIELKPETQFFAVLAAFRDLDDATWRAFTTIPPNDTTPLSVQLSGTTVTLSISDE